MTEHHTPFPWGIHLGDWHQGDDSIPLCVPSRDGGFCCLYDDASEAVACNLIENIALKLIKVLPDGAISVDLFDYSHRKRFMYLAALEPIDGGGVQLRRPKPLSRQEPHRLVAPALPWLSGAVT